MSAASTKGLLGGLSQERIVLGLSAVLFVMFSIFVSGFLTASNVLSLIQNVAILGLLGSGMAITIIGRGIDLSMVAIMAISVAWSLALFNGGMGAAPALLLGFSFALLIGLINGILIAYVEIPAIFTTLAMGTVVYGFGQFLLVPIDVTYVNESIGWIHQLGSGQTFGVPNSVISFAVLAAIAHLVLRATTFGRYLYAMGDNPPAARVAGVPTRPLTVAEYVASAAVAFLAGVVMAMAVDLMNTRIVNSTIVYDVILVAVIGGISLGGGKGGIRNVLVGTVLIGILLNGMTILNMPYTAQNIVKGMILLLAIVADSIFNPRDEQTSQQGDI